MKNQNTNYSQHVEAVDALLFQLNLADNWQWEELHKFLQETGAWPLMKEKLHHLGWVSLLEDVFETAYKAQD